MTVVRGTSARLRGRLPLDLRTQLGKDAPGRLFEPFYTTKGPAVGRGMSLAAAYGVIRQAGGQIKALPGPAGGTTMRIDLPLAAGAADS